MLKITKLTEHMNDKIIITSNLAEEIWTEHYSNLIPLEKLNRMISSHQSYDAIKSYISKGYNYYLLSYNDIYIGYFSIKRTDEGMYLDKAYLKKTARGKGYFSDIVDFIILECRKTDCHKIYLNVNSDNLSSIKAYMAKGFVIAREAINDFGDGAVFKDYVMEKSLI